MSYPRPEFEPTSRFLTIPLGKVSFSPLLTVANWKTCAEIRRNIYRILLLDPPETFLSTPWEQKDDDQVLRDYVDYGSGYQSNFFEHNYNDNKDAGYYLSMDQTFQNPFTEAPWVKKSIWKPREDPFSDV